jgi:hypothetical protein
LSGPRRPPAAARPRRLRGALALALALPLAAGALAQENPRKPAGPTDPLGCPWCGNDPARMEPAGVVSHGGFAFGKTDTARVDAAFPTIEIRWIETSFFRIGLALPPHKVKFEEKKKLLGELTRLQQKLPEVVPVTGTLDPWLRLHLYAQRCHDALDRFLTIMGAKDAEFSDGSGTWTGSYRGEGPYLGQKDKYEILVLPSESAHTMFLTEHTGNALKVAHRHHNLDRGALAYYCHTQEGQLRQDGALHNNIVFNLAHNFFDGFNHYSYDSPLWIHEGLAHFMEREIDERFNSFDSSEGGTAAMSSKANWKPDVLKLIAAGQAPRMAELLTLKSYAELSLTHHFTTWSMVDYLVQTNPEGFGAFLRAIKSNLDARGIPTGENLTEHHRKVFREHLAMSYAEFDEAWRAWVQIAYRPRPGAKGGAEDAPLPAGGLRPGIGRGVGDGGEGGG